MSKYKLDAEEILDRARGRWDTIYSHLAPSLGQAMKKWGTHVPCPVHGGTNGFRLVKTHRGAVMLDGQGVCNTCAQFLGPKGQKFLTGVGILMWVNGWGPKDYPRILEDIAKIVAPELLKEDRRNSKPLTPVAPRYTPPVRTEEDVKQDLGIVDRMRAVWNRGVPISQREARLAHRYFESRHLPVPTSKDGFDSEVRFVPLLRYRHELVDDQGVVTVEEGNYPAIVSLLRNKDGNVRAIHRTYIALDGWGKAPVSNPKKLMGKPHVLSTTGCAIRLGRPTENGLIATAEGLETALAVRAFTGFSCWPTYSSSLLCGFEPPKGIVGVHCFGDKDRSGAGKRAMDTLGERLVPLGYGFRGDLPPGEIPIGEKSIDWRDVYEKYGKDAIYQVESIRADLAKQKVVPIGVSGRRA